jgi:hypothetical protein
MHYTNAFANVAVNSNNEGIIAVELAHAISIRRYASTILNVMDIYAVFGVIKAILE